MTSILRCVVAAALATAIVQPAIAGVDYRPVQLLLLPESPSYGGCGSLDAGTIGDCEALQLDPISSTTFLWVVFGSDPWAWVMEDLERVWFVQTGGITGDQWVQCASGVIDLDPAWPGGGTYSLTFPSDCLENPPNRIVLGYFMIDWPPVDEVNAYIEQSGYRTCTGEDVESCGVYAYYWATESEAYVEMECYCPPATEVFSWTRIKSAWNEVAPRGLFPKDGSSAD